MRHFEDHTPTPVAVESPIRQPEQRQVGQTRGFLKRTLFPATLAATFIMPGMIDSAMDSSRNNAKAAMAEVSGAERGMPLALQMAHHSVASKMFGADEKGVQQGTRLAQSIAVNLNKHDFETEGAWRLAVEDFVGKGVRIAEDGKSFELNGTNISLSHGLDDKGNAYILGGQTEMTDGKLRMVSPGLIGGAERNEDSSAEELRQMASDDAKARLAQLMNSELAFAEVR